MVLTCVSSFEVCGSILTPQLLKTKKEEEVEIDYIN